jgi:hypothetical protein
MRRPWLLPVCCTIAFPAVDILAARGKVDSWPMTALLAGSGFLLGGTVAALNAWRIGLTDQAQAPAEGPESSTGALASSGDEIPGLRTRLLIALWSLVGGTLGGMLIVWLGLVPAFYVSAVGCALLAAVTKLLTRGGRKKDGPAVWAIVFLALPLFLAALLVFGAFIFWWVVPIVQGTWQFNRDNALDALHPWLPLLGGLLGAPVLVFALFPRRPARQEVDRNARRCPHCGGSLNADASFCRHCQKWLE